MATKRKAKQKKAKKRAPKWKRIAKQSEREKRERIVARHARGEQVRIPAWKHCEACGRIEGRVHKSDCPDPLKLADY